MAARIVVVDDNPINLKLSINLLELEGYEVRSAANAAQAQRLLEDYLPDLILMDIQMPGMDGLSLTRLLKALPRFADVPIVALTASAMRGDDLKALDAGCSGYITKPIDTRQFARQVERHLAAPGGVSDSRVKVVVIDDNRIDLKLMGTLLEISGHLVIGQASPAQALAELNACRPDVILLDLQLPQIDGLTLLRVLKAAPDTRDIPIVAVTAYPDIYRRAEVLAAGCAAYWIKPVDTRALVGDVEAIANRRGA